MEGRDGAHLEHLATTLEKLELSTLDFGRKVAWLRIELDVFSRKGDLGRQSYPLLKQLQER